MDGTNYPMIESAAADTTCSGSQSNQQQQDSPTSSSCFSSSPSSSDVDHHYSDMPPTKRQRRTSDHPLDDSAGFLFPDMKGSGGRRGSSLSSVVHPSGRVLPVGIAQPMQSYEQDLRSTQHQFGDCDNKPSLWKGGAGEGKKESHRSTSSSVEDEEEDVAKVMNQINTDLSSSDSESDSSSDNENAVQQQSMDHQYGNETETQSRAPVQMTRTLSALPPPLATTSVQPTLPVDKKLHVFLSHSTGDQLVVKKSIVVPLRDVHQMQVVACYHCMEGKQYNDKHIERAMTESCVMVVALSPSYLESQRCQREWRRASELANSEETGSNQRGQLVVAAVGKCSRPDKLKSFLYLDFIDKDKRETVLRKLVDTIMSTCLSGATEAPGQDGSTSYDESTPAAPETMPGGDIENNERDLLSLADASDVHQRRMEAEFEADFGEEFEADFQMGGGEEAQAAVSLEHGTMMSSHDPRTADLASEDSSRVFASLTVDGAGSEASQDAGPATSRRREKRGSEEVEEGEVSDSSSEGREAKFDTSEPHQSQQVARFYNELAQPDADKRDESPIFYMRNFNNWVKSVLLRTYIHSQITVLDLCCGKGGDLLKWKEGGIGYLICADISESSIEACKGRYSSPRMTLRSTRKVPFDAEFLVADCCSVRLRDMYRNSGCTFNIVSCQFAVHYAFETYNKAHMMLRNACENLRPGGYFIGTTIDSNELARRLREANQKDEEGCWYIGNNVFTVTLDPSLDLWKPLPLFAAKYNFKLHGVVDLPEYLVHFPLFVEMLKDFDMELVQRQNFTHFFAEHRHNPQNANLMFKMQAFSRQTATMPAALWEVIGLYLVYVFRKKDLSYTY